MAVTSGSIVEHLDVFEDVCLGEIACSVDLLPDSLLFQAAEERLRNRVVPTVPSAAHAGVELVCFAETDPVVANGSLTRTTPLRTDTHSLEGEREMPEAAAACIGWREPRFAGV